MHILTNPGSNLDEGLCLSAKVEVLAQRIVVDGISHDTRNTIDFGQVDAWIKRAGVYPHVQGTTEEDFLAYFRRAIPLDPEVLVVTTSRRIIGSHDAAVAAVATLRRSPDPVLARAKIEIVDSMCTDVGAGLVVLAAVQARAAGLSLEAVATFCRAFVHRAANVVTVATVENLVKGGRATWLQGWVANLLNVRPVLGFRAGVVASLGRMRVGTDVAERLTTELVDVIAPRTPVWVGVAHGNAPALADALVTRLRATFSVEAALVRPLSTSIYLHAGPGSCMAYVYPVEGLSFRPGVEGLSLS